MRTGVILATYGEPQINSFSQQWMYSYRILKGLTRKIAKIPKPLLPIIATARAKGRVRLWAEHNFTSPLEPLHLQTVEALKKDLEHRPAANDHDLVVTHAYEFRRPALADALINLANQRCDRIAIIPMYIAGGDFTDGMTQSAVAEALQGPAGRRWTPSHISYCPLSATPETAEKLAKLLAAHCLDTLAERGLTPPFANTGLMLAAHGTVISPPPGVDNGLAHFQRVLTHLRSFLAPHFAQVANGWLNHTRGGEWTSPAMPDALDQLKHTGVKNLVYFPWGFTTDNAETVLEGRMAIAEVAGSFEQVEHLPCINAAPAFVAYLAERLLNHLDRVPVAQERPHPAPTVRSRGVLEPSTPVGAPQPAFNQTSAQA